jgi:hypothetical protein
MIGKRGLDYYSTRTLNVNTALDVLVANKKDDKAFAEDHLERLERRIGAIESNVVDILDELALFVSHMGT